MASFSDDADWGAETDNSSKYPADGSDYCGQTGGVNYRVANKYNITSLPTDDTVSEVKEDIYVSNITGGGSSTWDCDGYGGDGQGNPETDSASAMFTACDITGVYASAITDFRTTGQKTITFASQANTDIEAARDAGTIFSVAWKLTTEAGTNFAEFREYNHGTTPPKLTVTHAAAGGGAASYLTLLGVG